MFRMLVLLAVGLSISVSALAADEPKAFGPVAKSIFSELATYKTVGEFSEKFIKNQIDDVKLREKFDGILLPKANDAFPKIEEMKDQRGFKVVHEGVVAEFVLVSARDAKWTVNGVEWRTSRKFDNPEAISKLQDILYPKKTSAFDVLVNEAHAQDGEAWRRISRELPVIGYPIGYLAGMVEYLEECWQRTGMNTWTPKPFSWIEQAVAGGVACPILSVMWPLSRWTEGDSIEWALKNLPEKSRSIPRLTCPSGTNRELKVEFLATTNLEDREAFTTYRWQQRAPNDRRSGPASLAFTNANGDRYSMNYPTIDRGNTATMRLSDGRTMRLGMGMASATTVAYNRFLAVCNDSARLANYQAMFTTQERKINPSYGMTPAPGARPSGAPRPSSTPRSGSR